MRKSTLFCLSVLLIIGILSADMLQADGHRRAGRHLGYDNRYRTVNDQREDKGSETVGGMAAWLLAAANLAVILSLLIKWTGKLTAVNDGTKKKLLKFNRFQKKRLMPLHYWVNPPVLVIALLHWLTSCCRSTSLPELGLLMMTVIMVLGLLLKLKLRQKPIQKWAYKIHTQPYGLIATVAILTIGHLIVA